LICGRERGGVRRRGLFGERKREVTDCFEVRGRALWIYT